MATCRNCGRSDHWTYSRGHDEEQGYWEFYRCECGETVDAADMDAANEEDPADAAVSIYRNALCMILDAPAEMAKRIATAALSGTLLDKLEVMMAVKTIRG